MMRNDAEGIPQHRFFFWGQRMGYCQKVFIEAITGLAAKERKRQQKRKREWW